MKYHKQVWITLFLCVAAYGISLSAIPMFPLNVIVAVGVELFGFAVAELVYQKLKEDSQ